jgi:hypothetical protein
LVSLLVRTGGHNDTKSNLGRYHDRWCL